MADSTAAESQTVERGSQTAQSQTGTSKIAGSHNSTASKFKKKRRRRTTIITRKGKYSSIAFLIFNIVITYSQRYTNLFPTIDANGATVYLGNSDIIWLYTSYTIGECIIYLFQSNSMWRDMTKKQFSLMFTREIFEMIAMWLNFASIWLIGITIYKTLECVSLVASALFDSVVFRKKWYPVDAVSVAMCVFAIVLTMISQYEPCNSAADVTLNITFYIGCTMRLVAAIIDSVVIALTEYVCKIDYPQQMVIHFGEDHEMGDKMPSVFFQGVSGAIGLTLNASVGVLVSVLPGNVAAKASNGRMASIVDTATKIKNSRALLFLVIGEFVAQNTFQLLQTYTTSEVSGLATFLIKRASAIPLFLLNIWVFTRPVSGEPLEHFDPKLWSQWLLVLALFYSFLALPIYYEIGIAKRWRRPKT